jgi:predicted P-loop ATPase
MTTGAWADFATGDKGGDIVALYAAHKGIKQGEACKELTDKLNLDSTVLVVNGESKVPPITFGSLPLNKNGKPEIPSRLLNKKGYERTGAYKYYVGESLAFLILRFDCKGQKKQFRPIAWDKKNKKFVAKQWTGNRPLYNPTGMNNRAILLVEGEKCAEFASKVLTRYDVITWSGGVNAIDKTDWSYLENTPNKIYYWRDNDDAGDKSVAKLSKHINISHIISNPEGDICDLPKGTDYVEYINKQTMSSQTLTEDKAVEIPLDNPTPPASVDFSSISSPDELWELFGLKMSGKEPAANADNVLKIMERDPKLKGALWYDEFKRSYMCTLGNETAPHPLEEPDFTWILLYVQRVYGISKICKHACKDAALFCASLDRRNSVKDWMESLKWDGVPRVNSFFSKYMGADNGEEFQQYTDDVSKNFWIALVARVFDAGCQVDEMVVLEGKQGIYKTSALRIIGGDYHICNQESFIGGSRKDFFIGLQGNMLVIFDEMEGFSIGEEKKIKTIITNPVDSFRIPYMSSNSKHPRQCLFVGTTNDDEYLEDPTGGRRFYPMKCGTILKDELIEDREQLFAESVHRYNAKEPWWIKPDRAVEMQERRFKLDAWNDAIEKWLYQDNDNSMEPLRAPFKLIDVAYRALEISPKDFDQRQQKRLAKVMKKLGFKSYASNGERGWVRESLT